jgi:hypothetical protein
MARGSLLPVRIVQQGIQQHMPDFREWIDHRYTAENLQVSVVAVARLNLDL